MKDYEDLDKEELKRITSTLFKVAITFIVFIIIGFLTFLYLLINDKL